MEKEKIVEAYENFNSYVNLLGAVDKAVKELTEIRNELELTVMSAASVDEIVESVPIGMIGGNEVMQVAAIQFATPRYARVYRNANESEFWGLTLNSFDNKPYGGEFMGSHWKTKKAALNAAKLWVATGEKPEFDGVKK